MDKEAAMQLEIGDRVLVSHVVMKKRTRLIDALNQFTNKQKVEWVHDEYTDPFEGQVVGVRTVYEGILHTSSYEQEFIHEKSIFVVQVTRSKWMNPFYVLPEDIELDG